MTKNINPGSNFLHSLLDGHPEILIPPAFFSAELIETWAIHRLHPRLFLDVLFERLICPMLIKSEEKKKNDERDPELLQLISSISTEFSEKNKTNWKHYTLKIFSEFQSHGVKTTLVDILRIVYVSYALHRGIPLTDVKIGFVHVHFMFTDLAVSLNKGNYHDSALLREIYPDRNSRLLHITRDPRANFASGVYSPPFGGRFVTETLLQLFREYNNVIKPFQTLFGPRFYCIKNEDLHTKTESTLKNLCEWMCVSYLPRIFDDSTLLGIHWKGFSSFGFSRTFDPQLTSNGRWLSRLKTHEKETLEYILHPFLSSMNYQTDKPTASRLGRFWSLLKFALLTDAQNEQLTGKQSRRSIYFSSIKQVRYAFQRLKSERPIKLS